MAGLADAIAWDFPDEFVFKSRTQHQRSQYDDPIGEARIFEPTNNASERSLRHAVIWRKLSFGTQSARGSRLVETILTVVETCRQQSRSVFSFVGEAMQAHFANQSAPSLLAGACTIPR
jgi:hypothetical protein